MTPVRRRRVISRLAGAFLLSAALPLLSVLGAPVQAQGICDRNEHVQTKILEALSQTQCGGVTNADLAGITGGLFVTSVDTEVDPLSVSRSDFAGLTNLTRLHLGFNHIGTLPEDVFRDLTALETLWLNGNRLTTLPPTVFQGLGDLRNLNIPGNRFSTLPEGLFAGLTLDALTLDENQLTSLPAGLFRGVNRLERLVLAGNQLGTLPEALFQGVDGLEILELQDNRLTELPVVLFRSMRGLENVDINLDGNRLETLPEGIFDGLHVGDLSMDDNRFRTLPDNVFRGLNAINIYLQDNQLRSLPEGLFQRMSRLLNLLLRNNRLTELPAGLFQGLSGLIHLELQGNLIVRLPDGIFAGLDIQDYMDLEHASSTDPVDPVGPIEIMLSAEAAGGGDGVVFSIREGAPHDVALTIMVQRTDGVGDAVSVDLTFPAGVTRYLPAAHLFGFEPGTMVTATVAAQRKEFYGYDIVVGAAELQFSVPFPTPDVNGDDRVDASDALILYYAFSLRGELGSGR